MRAAISIACFAAAMWSSPAHATDDVKQREANDRFSEGLALADAGRDDEARVKFAQAYLLGSSPSALFNLARTEDTSGHTLDALRHWREYASLPASPKVTPDHLERARSAIAELSKKVGHIAIESPAGARITLDGLPAGEAPLSAPLDVEPGRHAIQAADRRVEVDAPAGQVVTVQLRLRERVALPVAPAPRAPGETFWTTRNTIGIVLGGVVVASGTVGVGFVVGSNNASANARALRASSPSGTGCTGALAGGCFELTQATSTQESDKNAAGLLLVGAGVFALSSLAVFAFWPAASSKTEVGFTPLLLPGGAGGRWTF